MHRVVYLKTTDTCNLNCAHCYTSGSNPPRTYWNTDKTKKWISQYMGYISEKDIVHFEFHGGEPMLAPLEQLEDMRDFLRTFKSRVSIGMTTNLVYKLSEQALAFMVSLDGVGTSWDPTIRFDNSRQLELWQKNMKALVSARASAGVVLNVSVSKAVVDMDQVELLLFLKSTGAYRVLFDRITLDGNAAAHIALFPSNHEINDWYLNMHNASENLGARKWFENAALEDVYAKFEKKDNSCGTFCRDCEERLFTINSDGSIGGCPNSAPSENYATIDMPMAELFTTSKRIGIMASERARNEKCYVCPVFSYCGSDCHQLAWQGNVCASPKQLMRHLAGMDYFKSSFPHNRIIPILKV